MVEGQARRDTGRVRDHGGGAGHGHDTGDIATTAVARADDRIRGESGSAGTPAGQAGVLLPVEVRPAGEDATVGQRPAAQTGLEVVQEGGRRLGARVRAERRSALLQQRLEVALGRLGVEFHGGDHVGDLIAVTGGNDLAGRTRGRSGAQTFQVHADQIGARGFQRVSQVGEIARRGQIGFLGSPVDVGRLGQAKSGDRLAVVGAAVYEQRVRVVRDAGVGVNAAAVGRRAVVLGVRYFAGVAHAGRRPHVPDRAAEGGRILAHQPAIGILGCAAARQVHGRIDARFTLDQVARCQGYHHGGNGDGRIGATHRGRRTHHVVGHDHTGCAGILGILDLDGESAGTAIDQSDVAAHSAAVGQRLAGIG